MRAVIEIEKSVLALPPDTEVSIIPSEFLSEIRRLYERYETEIELDWAERIVSGNKPHDAFHSYLLFERFMTLVRNEIRLGEICEADSCLMVGCGPLPITAILLTQLSGCSVTCLEKDAIRTQIATDVVSALGLSERISIRHSNGEHLREGNYSAAIIALLARPKDRIIGAISRLIPEDGRILCRTSEGARRILYQPAEYLDPRQFHISALNSATGDQTISSLLLRKANYNAAIEFHS